MLKSEKVGRALMVVMIFGSMLCFVGALCAWAMAGNDLYFHEAEADVRERDSLMVVYVLASVGVALWIGIWRMVKADHQAAHDERDEAEQSRASST